MTDLLFILGAATLAVLLAWSYATLRRRRATRLEQRFDDALTCGYHQGIADARLRHDNAMRGAKDEIQYLAAERATAVQAARDAQVRHAERVRSLVDRTEQLLAENTELRAKNAVLHRKLAAADGTVLALDHGLTVALITRDNTRLQQRLRTEREQHLRMQEANARHAALANELTTANHARDRAVGW